MYGDDYLKQTVLIIPIRNHNFFPEEMCENSSVYLHNTKPEKKAQKQDTTKKRFSEICRKCRKYRIQIYKQELCKGCRYLLKSLLFHCNTLAADFVTSL